jgi:hypothetical protein
MPEGDKVPSREREYIWLMAVSSPDLRRSWSLHLSSVASQMQVSIS